MKEEKNIDETGKLINDLARLFKDTKDLPEGSIKEAVDKIISREKEIAEQNKLKK